MEELPPGYRFYPTEEELVSFYLHNKLEGRREDDLNRLIDRVIPVVDIYEFNPWDLPQISGAVCHGDPEQWFFFIPRQEREARGGRPNRLTTSGYWKATGSPGYVYSSDNRYIGVKRTMVFYQGRAPTGRKSQWKMNEYRAIQEFGDANIAASSIGAAPAPAPPVLRHEFSLCRVYIKSKCFRAFDRRPSRAVVMSEQAAGGGAQQAHGARGEEVATTREISPQINPRAVEKITSSPESSSSGDHGDQDQHRPPDQTGESSSNWDMAVDNEPWWDREHMNMF